MTETKKLSTHEEIKNALKLAESLNSDEKAVVMVKGYNDDTENFTAIYQSELDEFTAQGGTFEEWIEGWSDFQLWTVPSKSDDENAKSAAIRKLNDAFRASPSNYHITAGVRGMGTGFIESAVNLVKTYDKFTLENDPHEEHDFGAILVDGNKVFWKIDCYDQNLQFGSEDPADASKTRRVLTIMLAEEY